ncbi:hypothetical protein [Halorubrum tebenquichense]|uniref:Uncharacterized protein n=1 Tax=Halorubrum tebenquichense DSM 14210 TaxID=1227485 RepID=M0E3U9_9EURY|nr:hypothetical protein [Halorubrum tebenquichense]ELZ41617.1 hypothetical protein C472_00753 [Halorubrum tebenquichense DSM 14210]
MISASWSPPSTIAVFSVREREAWEEGIDEADEMSEPMTTAEALHKAMMDREGVDEIVGEHTEERTQAFV